MKLYAIVLFLSMYSYQMQSADSSLPYDRIAELNKLLESVNQSQQAHFKARADYFAPAKLPIDPANERAICQRLSDTNLQMHKDAIKFMRGVVEQRLEPIDVRLLTSGCVMDGMRKLQERPSTPRSAPLVAEFFTVKKPLIDLYAKERAALAAAKKDAALSDDE